LIEHCALDCFIYFDYFDYQIICLCELGVFGDNKFTIWDDFGNDRRLNYVFNAMHAFIETDIKLYRRHYLKILPMEKTGTRLLGNKIFNLMN
jgi:hypothetical protein